MRFGMNLLLWTDTLHDGVRPLLDEIKQLGFDAVEVPVFEHDVDKYAQWGKYLDEAGLARTGVTVRGADDNPISPDPEVRRRAVEATKAALDCCQAAGVETLCGPFHSALGVFTGRGPTEDEWKWGVESMQQVAEYADTVGVNLGVEYLNRFECYFLNCAADAARFCGDVGHPRCKLMYDTFHAHIEEKRWPENFDTLKEIGYDNLMVIEAFGLALEKLVPATKIWRRMYEDEKQLAAEGLAFMKAEVARRWG